MRIECRRPHGLLLLTGEQGEGGAERAGGSEVLCECGYVSKGMIRRMNSSKRGTVNAVSPWLGLQIMPLAIS